MSYGVPAVSSIAARIEHIEQRFAPARERGREVVAVGKPFDAFGEVYQRALATRPIAAPATLEARGITERLVTPHGSVAHSRLAPTSGGVPSRGSGGIDVPAELAPYGNGRVPAAALQPIAQRGHRLWAPAAGAWDALVEAAAAAGFDLRITDSYRSYEQQVDLARRKGLYKEGGLAAVPGTSNHGWGLAVDADVRDPALLAWLRQNGPMFGWHERVPREPWHWEYHAAT